MTNTKFTQYLLDTNVLRPLNESNNTHHSIVHAHYERVHNDCIWIPIVVVAESMKGFVNSIKDGDDCLYVKKKYALFLEYFRFISNHNILEFNDNAAEICKSMSNAIGARDRRIAASALAGNYKIVTQNTKHFRELGVPMDMLADWTIDLKFD